ncbi:acyltransferase family protein [Flavobacterium sp.]
MNKFIREQQRLYNRIQWVDQLKGVGIFLVVYAHNFPITETYIYSFHMPLFFMIAGFFHPETSNLAHIKKRVKGLLVPYFILSLLLFTFWVFVGKDMGESQQYHLSTAENFFGIFYSQGGMHFMDWGIPMWFLPALFVTYLIFYVIEKYTSGAIAYIIVGMTMCCGFIYSLLFPSSMMWSINIAMVAVGFYAFGFYLFNFIDDLSNKKGLLLAAVFGLLNFYLYRYNTKVDMYRADYGYHFLFVLNGLTGSLFIIFLFKSIPMFSFLRFIGKFSIIILAFQLVAMSFIKFILMYVFHRPDFNFSETEKFVYAIVQIALMVPGFYFINRYIPILNGGFKKL